SADLARILLRREQWAGFDRQRALFPQRRRLPDACSQGSAAARPEVFQTNAEVRSGAAVASRKLWGGEIARHKCRAVGWAISAFAYVLPDHDGCFQSPVCLRSRALGRPRPNYGIVNHPSDFIG